MFSYLFSSNEMIASEFDCNCGNALPKEQFLFICLFKKYLHM